MLSKKNQNQAFVYEEEFNQSNDSLEKNDSDNFHPIFIIGNERITIEPEKLKLFMNLIKNVYPQDSKVKKKI